MEFPFYEIQLKPKALENDKYKAGCCIRKHTGDSVIDIMSKWELKGEFDSKEAANKIMKFNAHQYLIRKYGAEELEKVKIVEV